MSEVMVLVCEGLVGAAVFVYCFVFKVIKGKSRKQKFIEKAKQRGCVTTGRFKEQKVRWGEPSERGSYHGDNDFIVTYTYMVDDVTYEKVLVYSTPTLSTKYPTQIEIYYDPKNPKKSVALSEATKNAQQGHGCLITVVATLVAMGLTVNILNRIFGIHFRY